MSYYFLEKNPGLFLKAAADLLKENPYARFIIIGDGPLRKGLEDLAQRLHISWAVLFTGWVGTEPSTPSVQEQQQTTTDNNKEPSPSRVTRTLPEILMQLDVVVNPSLRGWSETFCIANIEVMAMEVPLVTFAVGGK